MDFNSTEHAISWFRNQYRDGNLIIKPPFQRKPVWTARQKNYLIESILLRLPVPEIYVQQITSPEGDTTYAVVDGQQRIRTVLQFVGSEEDPDEMEHNKFVLDNLPTSSPWRNLSFADLSPEERSQFYGYRFSVRYLNTDDDEKVRDMFKRLNKFLTPLNAQELRNATYSGPFVELTVELADKEYWTENRLFTPAFIRRMKDVEYVSDLLIGVLHGPQAGSASVIDSYYQQYEDYEDEFPDQARAEKLFNQSLTLVQKLVPDIKEVRWGNRTDFYTLFVALASLLRANELPEKNVLPVKETLHKFAHQVDTRLANEDFRADGNVVEYVRSVEKGANDKGRRANRHKILLSILDPYFDTKSRGRLRICHEQ